MLMSGPVYPKCNLNLPFVRYTNIWSLQTKVMAKEAA
jgi:hypothetical protein